MQAPALVPPTVTPRAFCARISLATGVPPSSVVSRSWLPPVKKMPLASRDARKAARFLAVAARVEVHDVDAARAELAEELLVALAGLVRAARGRDHDDVGVVAAGLAHEAREDARVVFLVLGAADRNDAAARLAFGDPAWAHAT